MRSEKLRVKKEKYKFREFGAITLISLVITIVVLIILASVAIYLGLGNNGIFTRAKQAKEVTNKQEATDIINLKITTAQMNKYAEKQEMPTLKELSEVLRDDSEIQYVTETSKVAVAEYDVPSKNPTSIYTKLNKYPYEFEINGQLQLASIDGIKVANNIAPVSTSWKKYMMNEDGYVIGNTEVTLPNAFTELYVALTIDYNEDYKMATVIYNYNILYDTLFENKTPRIEGFSISGYTNYARIDISKTKLNVSEVFFNSNNKLNITKIEIWYK